MILCQGKWIGAIACSVAGLNDSCGNRHHGQCARYLRHVCDGIPYGPDFIVLHVKRRCRSRYNGKFRLRLGVQEADDRKEYDDAHP